MAELDDDPESLSKIVTVAEALLGKSALSGAENFTVNVSVLSPILSSIIGINTFVVFVLAGMIKSPAVAL